MLEYIILPQRGEKNSTQKEKILQTQYSWKNGFDTIPWDVVFRGREKNEKAIDSSWVNLHLHPFSPFFPIVCQNVLSAWRQAPPKHLFDSIERKKVLPENDVVEKKWDFGAGKVGQISWKLGNGMQIKVAGGFD